MKTTSEERAAWRARVGHVGLWGTELERLLDDVDALVKTVAARERACSARAQEAVDEGAAHAGTKQELDDAYANLLERTATASQFCGQRDAALKHLQALDNTFETIPKAAIREWERLRAGEPARAERALKAARAWMAEVKS